MKAERRTLREDLIRAYGVLPKVFQDLDRLEL